MADQITFFEQLAEERHTTVEDIRRQIVACIEDGMNDPNPVRRAQWEKIPRAGEIPTPEEWQRYAEERLQENGAESLLKRYLIGG